MSTENVTNRDILLQLHAGQNNMQAEVSQLRVDVAEIKGAVGPQTVVIADHEARLRNVERFKNAVPSVAFLSLLVAIVAAVAAFIH